jgi:hypothetical protein
MAILMVALYCSVLDDNITKLEVHSAQVIKGSKNLFRLIKGSKPAGLYNEHVRNR